MPLRQAGPLRPDPNPAGQRRAVRTRLSLSCQMSPDQLPVAFSTLTFTPGPMVELSVIFFM